MAPCTSPPFPPSSPFVLVFSAGKVLVKLHLVKSVLGQVGHHTLPVPAPQCMGVGQGEGPGPANQSAKWCS